MADSISDLFQLLDRQERYIREGNHALLAFTEKEIRKVKLVNTIKQAQSIGCLEAVCQLKAEFQSLISEKEPPATAYRINGALSSTSDASDPRK